MKKKTCLLILPLLALALLFGAGRAEAAPRAHTTTVMVYMCGSDLESRFGSASKDLSEMLQAGFDTEHTEVLVMVGGSKDWKLGFDAGKTAILEIGGHGMRTVWRSEEPLNMAESATLSTFLEYVYSHYESERYALILWDHGGGPNEGACYDELFAEQTLTLPALKEALQNSKAAEWKNELNWIGFDACLMANVETCYYLSDYAKYLIASQDEEPASGWNYAFLKGLETDENEEETGRRIVDCFFESADEDGLTLSCVDLGKLWPLRRAINTFFDGLYPSLSDETYSELSRRRHQSRGFGRAEYNTSADYDLVDLLALTEAYEGADVPGKALKEALNDMVVYARSSEDGANGLSLYHPCYNRASYTAAWAENYEQMFAPMAENYVQYIKRFGHILTGRQLGDWSGLDTQRSLGPDGELRFSVKLSEEQAANFEHATLMVLRQVFTQNAGLDSTFYSVWETPFLQPDGDRVLSAAFPNKAVYVVDNETGKRLGGPINYRVRQDGRLMISALYLGDNGILDEGKLNVMYCCDYSEESGALSIAYACAYDEVTGEYSRRMTLDDAFFRDSHFTSVDFFILEREPAKKGGELLGFHDWPSGSSYVYIPVDLPRSWHFEVVEDTDEPETVYAFFQITDTQNVTHSSSLCQAFPELIRDCEVVGSGCEALADGMRLEATAQHFLAEDAVCIRVRLLDAPNQLYAFRAGDVIANDTVRLGTISSFSSQGDLFLTLTRDITLSLSEIRSLDFTLTAELSDYSEYGTAPIRLDFPVPIALDREGVAPLASAVSADGLEWTIWDVQQKDNGAFLIQYEVCNASRKTEKIDFDDIALEGYVSPSYRFLTLEPGARLVDNLAVSPQRSDSDNAYTIISVISEPLAELGIDSISSLRFFYQDETKYPGTPYEVGFSLREPCPCERLLPRRPMLDRELMAADGVRLRLGQAVLFRDSDYDRDAVSLGLWLYNDSDENHAYVFECFSVDGRRILNRTWDKTTSCEVPAHTVKFCYLQVELPAGTAKPAELSFAVFVGEDYLQDVFVDLSGLL